MLILCTDVYLNVIYVRVLWLFRVVAKGRFFLCKPNFVSIMSVKGSLLFKKNVD